MSGSTKRPQLADAIGAEKARVSTRITRAAPWVGLLAVAFAGVMGFSSVALAAAGLSVLATNWMRVFGRHRFRRMRADDVVEVSLGESEPKGTTLILRDARGAEARVRFGSATDAPEVIETLELSRRRLAVVSESELARAFGAVLFVALVVGAVSPMSPHVFIHFGGRAGEIERATTTTLLLLLNTMQAMRSALPPRRTLVIGADGVRIGRKFLAARDIETVSFRVRWEIVIRTKDGAEHVAPIGTSTDARTTWLVERIRAVAREAHDDAAALARGGRALDAWRRDVESRVRAGYRDGALTPERLATVLDDPTAIPDRRLGAALALLAATPEAQRPAVRVRVAELAEAAADDRLAKAFEELSRDALTPRTAARVREA